MNKGLKILFCKECNRKRYCKSIPIPGYNFKKICSQGHSWIIKGMTVERIDAALTDTFLPKISDIFSRDDAFYRQIKK